MEVNVSRAPGPGRVRTVTTPGLPRDSAGTRTKTRTETTQQVAESRLQGRVLLSVVCQGLLSLLVLSALIGIRSYCYSQLTESRSVTEANSTTAIDQLKASCEDLLTKERHRLQASYNAIRGERDNLQREVEQMKVKIRESVCPEGWTRSVNSCYYLTHERASWRQSRANCRERGADMVIINSQQEHGIIKLLYTGKTLWIGLTDMEEEGVWRWVDGSVQTTSGFWDPSEPNNANGTEDCVEIVMDTEGWNDINCNVRLSTICENQID